MLIGMPWFCDSCGRQNGVTRYQCQHCRGNNTYDLCDQCIVNAPIIHPYHAFKLVQGGGNGIPSTNVAVTYPNMNWSSVPYYQSAHPAVG
ncbi:unnamed protein product [Adineta ricciae]|uniref:RanBP2-type domain-containing protein n=1 Tax=Adineta ricciae TaxID=249248 RepID=A0A814C615_ADIRI|nr:unnamed protein product [Adineta ricciae]CAF1091946.1 unnamed protein product [Adineta ricciae]